MAKRRTGAVCESRDTILVTQSATVHIMEHVQGYGKITCRKEHKMKLKGNKKQERKRNKHRHKKRLKHNNKHEEEQESSIKYSRLTQKVKKLNGWKIAIITIISLIIWLHLSVTGHSEKNKSWNGVGQSKKGMIMAVSDWKLKEKENDSDLICPRWWETGKNVKKCKSSYKNSRGEHWRNAGGITTIIMYHYIYIHNKFEPNIRIPKYPMRTRNNGKSKKFC